MQEQHLREYGTLPFAQRFAAKTLDVSISRVDCAAEAGDHAIHVEELRDVLCCSAVRETALDESPDDCLRGDGPVHAATQLRPTLSERRLDRRQFIECRSEPLLVARELAQGCVAVDAKCMPHSSRHRLSGEGWPPL